ncbi:class I SAM-dependent DNA methyltransferase [Streptomyces sp. NPDC015140]|uniref:HsdM family class I SAM-dependent methyltransferase n=1 Tax=Streptomyces sp. NPDC015140 TaxID=3364943 RepID=UPI0036FBE1A6
MSTQSACRVALGLIYVRNQAQNGFSRAEENQGEGGAGERPPWSWLVAQAAKSSPLGPHVRRCVRAWLVPAFGTEGWEAVQDFVPHLPPTVDEQLRALVTEIDRADRVVELLEQCLDDLSAAQARGGHYFTSRDLVRLMVEAVAPQNGDRVLDPVCGSAGLLAEAERYVRERTGLQPNLMLTGRDLHADTLQIARLNLAARGIRADLGAPTDSLSRPVDDPYDIVMANPPFNLSDWSVDRPLGDDPRWAGTVPPRDNANHAWMLHIAHALGPQGRASVLMADGAATGLRPSEQRIRERLVREDLVECVIALPPGLFPHVRIPCCLWLLNRDKSPHRGWGSADRRKEVLFVNARSAYEITSGSRQRRLAADGADRILRTLAAWRGAPTEQGGTTARYEDESGWCTSMSTAAVATAGYVLLPVTHALEPADEHVAARERVEELKWELYDKFEESYALEQDLRRILDGLDEL